MTKPLYDRDGQMLQVGQTVRVKHCVGPYGQTHTTTGEIQQIHDTPFGLTLKLTERNRESFWGCVQFKDPGESVYRPINVTIERKPEGDVAFARHTFDDIEHGHETWVEIV